VVSFSDYSSALKIEATFSSETSIDFQRTTRLYIPEDGTVHIDRCQNLRACTNRLVFVTETNCVHCKVATDFFKYYLDELQATIVKLNVTQNRPCVWTNKSIKTEDVVEMPYFLFTGSTAPLGPGLCFSVS
jgi:hypothetical protein